MYKRLLSFYSKLDIEFSENIDGVCRLRRLDSSVCSYYSSVTSLYNATFGLNPILENTSLFFIPQISSKFK